MLRYQTFLSNLSNENGCKVNNLSQSFVTEKLDAGSNSDTKPQLVPGEEIVKIHKQGHRKTEKHEKKFKSGNRFRR